MCGIAGFFAKDATLPSSLLETMTLKLAHRGPDDQGFYGLNANGDPVTWKLESALRADLRVGLGFRRLAILDLSENGAQPMGTPEGRFQLVFNGQIYNYVELRDELAQVVFRSTSDTEVLLNLLARRGLSALDSLDGMFAFAFFDREEGVLQLVRDPVGIKPLYYFEDHRGFFFSSELRSLVTALMGKPELEASLLSRYFLNGWLVEPETIYRGIKKLEPGHVMTVRWGKIEKNRPYWDFDFRPEAAPSFDDWVEQLDSALKISLRRQLRSDVPVAFFLSGGVDSSLLSAEAAAIFDQHPTTYTIGFKWHDGGGVDADLEAARLLKQKYDFDYQELLLEPSIVSLLPRVVQALEEPIADAAAICSYLICQVAGSRFKVLVSGQGADELFGGYPIFQAGFVSHKLESLPRGVRRVIAGLARGLPYSIGKRAFQNVHRLRKITQASVSGWPESFCLLRSPMRHDQVNELLRPELRASQWDPFAAQRKLIADKPHLGLLDQMLYIDSKTYLPALNLAYSDKTSMAHSVELRVPYLGRSILDLVQRMPSSAKFGPKGTKLVLKAVAEERLPPQILKRPKAGFGLPLRQWFLGELQPMARELLAPERLAKQGLFEPNVPTRWLQEHADRKADHCMKLYALMAFQLWHEQFLS